MCSSNSSSGHLGHDYSKSSSLRTRHFSAPDSIDLQKLIGPKARIELQWRLSLLKSPPTQNTTIPATWLRRSTCRLRKTQCDDEQPSQVSSEPLELPQKVETRQTCQPPTIEHEYRISSSLERLRQPDQSCCRTDDFTTTTSPSSKTTATSLMNSTLPLISSPTTTTTQCSRPYYASSKRSRELWPSYEEGDPGGGIKRSTRKISSHLGFLRRELLVLFFSFSLLLSGLTVEGKRCGSVSIRHDVSQFEKLEDCSMIEGHLIIAAMHDRQEVNLTFPKLREVTDYVILYEAQNIQRLNDIFPNLAVIRGNKLVMDFALVIYQMNFMEEVGLTGLTHILRGGVRIEKNRNLCYVNTVNWRAIVNEQYHANIHIEENEYDNMCTNYCPKECPIISINNKNQRNCWNGQSCQIDPNNLHINNILDNDKCDHHCIGGCFGPSHRNCFACAKTLYVQSDGTKSCIEKCPEPYILFDNWRCILEGECDEKVTTYNAETIGQERPYKKYKGKCLEYCPAETQEVQTEDEKWTCEECRDCSKECPGVPVRSLETLRKFEGCTKIVGDLIIQISGKNVVDELEKNLGKVTVITGSLKISRSFPIISLDFFKSLKEIQGTTSPDSVQKAQYSLEILENENLQKLFPADSNVKITLKNGPDAVPTEGKAFIHYNQKLCRSEIKQLLETSQMYDPGDNSADISYGTNGHKSVCSEKKLNLTVVAMDVGLQLTFDNYQQDMVTVEGVDQRALLNYEIHYREIDEATFKAENVTKFGGRDACGNDEWMIDDHPPSGSIIHEDKTETWLKETTIITNGIKPYSYYAIFVTTLIIREGIEGGKDIKSAASDIYYFRTPEGQPEPPEDILVTSVNYSSVNFTWNEPELPNGIIDHYVVEVTHNGINAQRLLRVTPYCEGDYRLQSEETERSILNENEKNKDGTDKKANNNNGGGVELDAGQGVCDCSSSCGLDAVKNKGHDKGGEVQKVEEAQFHDELLNMVYVAIQPRVNTRRKRSNEVNNATSNDIIGVKTKKSSKYDEDMEDEIETKEILQPQKVFEAKVNGTKRQLMINNLTHFSKYTITIKACHKRDAVTGEQRCSEVVSTDFRTDKKEGADDITYAPRSNSEKNNSTDVWITWDDPPDPNLAIIYYKIKVTMRHTEKSGEYCENAYDFIENNRRYRPAVHGSFTLQVRAVSLAGAGAWSPELEITIGHRNQTLLWAVLVPVVIIIGVLIAILVYLFYKRQRPKGDETTMNPIYWKRNFEGIEIARDLIERGRELGTGSFGTVYQGVYKHATKGEIKCAIKEAKNDMLREQLLSEADLMRTIDTPHVVQLLGVVTEGFPQFVVLELMGLGDLKKHLRNLRRTPPNQNDILLMAIQVADGMAYLSTVPNPKIIHRDLAARNCMVNDQVIVKIGDFGLARDLCYAQDYYRMNGKDWLPVRWMSPESLVDSVFSLASDVWAYGVVLWEMVTLAEQPYQGLSNDEVLNFVKNRRTMNIPINCPELIARLMEACWQYEPADRPTFVQICQQLLEYDNPEYQASLAEFRRNSFITSSLCQRILQKMEMASGDQDDLPIDEAERAPLQANGSNSNGNGEVVRQLDNGHAIIISSENMRDFNGAGGKGDNATSTGFVSPRQHNMWDRFRKILRNRYRPGQQPVEAVSSHLNQASTSSAAVVAASSSSVQQHQSEQAVEA